MEPSPLVAVVNPRTLRGPCGPLATRVFEALRADGPLTVHETAGDGTDAHHIDALLAAERPRALIAAGGDGTVREVAAALLRVEAAHRPWLGILPLGTGNNVARALGLTALRSGGHAAADRAAAVIRARHAAPLDVGEVNGHCFVGSFAVGMDGEILASRNRWSARYRLGRGLGGYPLYLLSCAINLARQRAVVARLSADGAPLTASVHNLLVTNTALYAGEFRFDDGDHSHDGRLDLFVFSSPADYVRCFAAAWRRHVHAQRGEPVAALPRLRRIETLEIELTTPLASQVDGEELPRAARYTVRVLPGALRVCTAG